MNPQSNAGLWARAFLLTAIAGATVADPAPYDPVKRAIDLGLSPESVDDAFDKALSEAEACDANAQALLVMGCPENAGPYLGS